MIIPILTVVPVVCIHNVMETARRWSYCSGAYHSLQQLEVCQGMVCCCNIPQYSLVFIEMM